MSVSLCTALLLAGCIKDRSSLPNSDPKDNIEIALKVENVEDPDNGLNIESKEHLILTPEVKAEQGVNLEYKWTLTKTSDNTILEDEIISKDKNLDYVVDRPESSEPYQLTFTVINKDKSDLELSHTWPLYVHGFVASGIVVADTKDDKTTDLSYLKSPVITRAYTGEAKTKMHLLGDKAPEMLVSSMNYGIEGNILFKYVNHLWITSQDGKFFRYDLKTFAPMADSTDGKLFLYTPDGDFKVFGSRGAGQLYTAFTSAGIYAFRPKQNVNSFSVPIAETLSKPSNNLIVGNPNNLGETKDVTGTTKKKASPRL